MHVIISDAQFSKWSEEAILSPCYFTDMLLWCCCEKFWCPAFSSTFAFLSHNMSSHFSLIFLVFPQPQGGHSSDSLSPLYGRARVQWPLSAFPDKVFWGFERARKGRTAEWEELTSQDCCLWKEVEFSIGISYFPVLLSTTAVWGHWGLAAQAQLTPAASGQQGRQLLRRDIPRDRSDIYVGPEAFLRHLKTGSNLSQEIWVGKMVFFAVGCSYIFKHSIFNCLEN